jgi:hypothetical protein
MYENKWTKSFKTKAFKNHELEYRKNKMYRNEQIAANDEYNGMSFLNYIEFN